MGFCARCIAVVGLGLTACAASPTTRSAPSTPLPPLTRTSDDRPRMLAQGGTVVAPDGSSVDLSAVYAKSNAILVFYRGGW